MGNKNLKPWRLLEIYIYCFNKPYREGYAPTACSPRFEPLRTAESTFGLLFGDLSTILNRGEIFFL